MKITLDVIGDKELQKAILRLSEKRTQQVKGETRASGIDIQQKAKDNLNEHRKWDTGNLARSIMLQMENQGFTAKIEAKAPYAIYVEKGARPHFPPLDALEDWAKRHGFDSAWPIALAISKRGIPATPFLIPAFNAYKNKYYKRLKALVNK